MKLTKEEIQKIFLSLLLIAAFAYVCSTWLLEPLQVIETKALKLRAEVEPKLKEAKAQIENTRALTQRVPGIVEAVEPITSKIPDGAPVAWFPTRMADFFRRNGVEKISVRLNNEGVDKEMPGYGKFSWIIDLPQVDFRTLGRAIANLENEEPLLEVLGLQIEHSKQAKALHVTISVSTIVKQ